MYPLHQWKHTELCERLQLLEDHQLYYELNIATAQTLEQAMRRMLKQVMTIHRTGYGQVMQPDGKYKPALIPLTSTTERDLCIRQLQSVNVLKAAWGKLQSKHGYGSLPDLFDNVCGNNIWTVLTGKGKVLVPGQTKHCRMSFFQLRHLLVHATTAPPDFDVEVLAKFGHQVVKKFLDPQHGVRKHLDWNPTGRLRPFRKP